MIARDWHRGAIIYQIYPRSFADGNDDGVGDLPGILSRLDYIASLGVDGIWISPFFRSPMKDFGYDVADYRLVDPLFGSNDDFLRLLDAAHRRGLKVIIDMVLCHTSDQHPWFAESRLSRDNARADWYVWADMKPDGTEPNNWLSHFGGRAWTWEPRRGQYYLHHFLREQPNLNHYCPAVVDALLDECRYWLELGVDGFRLDAIHTVAHDPELRDNPPAAPPPRDGRPGPMPFDMQDQTARQFDQPRTLDFLAALRRLVDSYGDRWLLGEVGGPRSMETSARYTRGPRLLHATYNFGLLRLRPMTPAEIRAVIATTLDTIEPGKLVFATSNHDVPRVASRFVAGPLTEAERDDVALTVIAMETSLPGGACLYNGEELALPEAAVPFEKMRDPYGIAFYPEFPGRDGARTPMPWQAQAPQAGFCATAEPWLPIDPRHRARAVDLQEADPDSALNRTRRFLAWRRTQPALRGTGARVVDAGDDLVLVLRWAEAAVEDGAAPAAILCAFNFTREPVAVDLARLGLRAPQVLAGSGFAPTLAGDRLTVPRFAAAFVAVEAGAASAGERRGRARPPCGRHSSPRTRR